VVDAPIFIFDKQTCRRFRQSRKSWVVNSANMDVVSSVNIVAKAGTTATAALGVVCVQDVALDGNAAGQGTAIASKSRMLAQLVRTPTPISSMPPSRTLPKPPVWMLPSSALGPLLLVPNKLLSSPASSVVLPLWLPPVA
jgi:hypothetical protein